MSFYNWVYKIINTLTNIDLIKYTRIIFLEFVFGRLKIQHSIRYLFNIIA